MLRFGVGALMFAALAELLCRLLPVSTATEFGYHHDAAFQTYPAHHRWRLATGWDLRRAQTLSANNMGVAAGRDFVRDPLAVALVGDSYVEASAVEPSQRFGPQLERALGGARRVYEMGLPGTSLLDYAERIRYAHERFGVRDFVLFVELGDVAQSVCEAAPRGGVCLDLRSGQVRPDRLPEPSTLKRWIRHSALAQYIFSQLKVDVTRLWRQAIEQARTSASAAEQASTAKQPTHDAEADRRLADAVIDAFVERVRPYPTLRLMLLVDGARRADRPWSARPAALRSRLLQRAPEVGLVAIDLEPVYAEHHRHSERSLDIAPDDGHFNSLGLELVARQAARALTAAP